MLKSTFVLFENPDGSTSSEQVTLPPLDYGKALGGLALVLIVPIVLWVGITIIRNR